MRANAKKFRLALTWLALVGLALGLRPLPVARAASPIYVRPGGDDTLCIGTVDVDYSTVAAPNCAVKTIQQGIDLVDSPGTVNLAAGTYTPASTIVIDEDNLVLEGPQADADPRPSYGSTRTPGSASEAVIDGSVHTLGRIIYIDADNVVINGLEVKSGTQDMIRQSNSHSGAVVKYCIIHDGRGDEGVQLKKATNAVLEYNYVFGIADPGDALNIADDSSYGVIRYNEVMGIHGENAAIYIYDAEHMEIIGNLVRDSGSGGNDGIKVGDKHGSDATKTDVLVKDNIIHDITQDGISVYMSGVTVEGNEIYNCGSENGIIHVAWAVTDITIRGNIVRDNTLSTSKFSDAAGILIRDTVDVANVTVEFNNIHNNTPYGVTNHAAGTLKAENNWWGSVYGPLDDTGSTECLAPCEGGWNCDTCDKNTAPAGQPGDKVSENVDYCPWSLATLWLDPCGGWVEQGENVTVDVMMTSNGFNGVEFDLTYDPAVLTYVSVTQGSMWPVGTNVVQATGSDGTIEFAAFLQQPDTTLDVTQAQVARITFTGLADGESNLTFVNTILSNPDGEELGVSLETGCTLTVHGHGTVTGDVELQGRFVSGGSLERHAGAKVTITGGPGGGFEYPGYTDLNGHWEITLVVEGDYDVEVEMDRYLNAERSTSGHVMLSAGGSVDAGFVKLLGGDCDGNARVGSLDASIVGSQFGNSEPPPPGIGDYRADINDDYKVNILDCAILGGNYGKAGPLAW